MKITRQHPSQGIALIVVMLVIFMLSILAGGFAYSMKLELRLARNHNNESEMEWLGRSGVELARYVLAQQMMVPTEPWDSLNQKWAGGIGVTNEALADITLENNELGSGTFSVKIIDLERKFNINVADQPILQQAMNLAGLEAVDASSVVDAILDWRDQDENPHLSGVESDYYLGLPSPYYCKNGPLDDISELLLIKGVTPEIFWGPNGRNHFSSPAAPILSAAPSRNQSRLGFQNQNQDSQPLVGLVDLFTTLSGRAVNVNTASAAVLQLFPGIDNNVAEAIVRQRAGPDGTEGNEDDTPFRNVGELINVGGLNRGLVGQMGRFFVVRSGTFEVTVDVQIGTFKRQYMAMLRRNNARDIQILYFFWR